MVLKRDVIPLYHQLKELVTGKIESGEWEPGRQLPTEKELSTEFGVSRATVRQAMQLLEHQGLIERYQGRGTFVGRPKVANNLMMMFSPMRGMSGTDSVPRLDVEHFTSARPPASIAAKLDLGPADLAYEIKRIVVVDDEPLLIVHSWLSQARFPGFEAKFAAAGTVVGALKQYGIDKVFQRKEVEVTILDEDEAETLGVRAGAPGLLITYVTRLATGEALEYRRLVVRGDRCRYYVEQEGPEFLV